MTVLQTLRRRGSRLRDDVLYGRRDRRLNAEAEVIRTSWADRALDELPPLASTESPRVEVHTLCGEGQAVMGMWSSWSLMRFLPDGRLVVHSDGSLTERTVRRWKRLIPEMRVIGRETGLMQMTSELAPWPHALDWTQRYHFGFKLGGFYSLARAQRIVDMDSDVLVLTDPVALKACLDADDWRLGWNCDRKASYAYPEELLREIVGERVGKLPDRLNGGFLASWKFGEADWAFLDHAIAMLNADPRTDAFRFWMHQTLIALLASTQGDAARPLPIEYDIHFGSTRPGSAVRHFVGVGGVRPRFFTEGVPMVVRDARRHGQIPAGFLRDVVKD